MIVQPELGLGLELHRAKYVSLSIGAQNKTGGNYITVSA